MLGQTAIQKARDLISKATDEDKRRNFSEARQLYEHGIEYLLQSLKFEAQSEVDKQKLRSKCAQYLERAEKLKNFLNKTKAWQKAGGSRNNRTMTSAASDSDEDEDFDKKALISRLEGAIVVERNVRVRWEDVAGLDAAKEAIQEAVVMPLKFPQMFTGSRKPWRGILLFGPPGTGKSYLAQAVATETPNSTFFSVSSSDLVSKWLGESERLVRNLFQLAKELSPSIIFIDEVDSLCSARSETESESARRIKTELLVQLQGVGHDLEGVLVLAATNMPWLLDAGIRRRFERRIYIPLPDKHVRAVLFRSHMSEVKHELTEQDWRNLAERTEGFSGADISLAVREALLQPLRKLQTATHFKLAHGTSFSDPDVMREDMLTPCSPGDPNAMEMTLWQVPEERLLEPPVVISDMLRALASTKPSIHPEDVEKLEKFHEDFGMDG